MCTAALATLLFPRRRSAYRQAAQHEALSLPITYASWRSVRPASDILSLCPARFAHFALGFMTSREWVRFCALHTAYHLAVVRDIRAGAA